MKISERRWGFANVANHSLSPTRNTGCSVCRMYYERNKHIARFITSAPRPDVGWLSFQLIEVSSWKFMIRRAPWRAKDSSLRFCWQFFWYKVGTSRSSRDFITQRVFEYEAVWHWDEWKFLDICFALVTCILEISWRARAGPK